MSDKTRLPINGLKRWVLMCLIGCGMFTIAHGQLLKDMSTEALRSKLLHTSDASSKIDILQALSKAYLLKENNTAADLDTAAIFNKQAAFLAQQIKDDKAIGSSMLLSARNYQKREDYKNALPQINAALALFKKGNYKGKMGEAYAALADNFVDTGISTDNKIAYYKQAITLLIAAESNEITAETLINLGDCYFTKGDYKNALSVLQQALAIYQSINYQKLDQLYGYIGLAYYKLNDIVTAYKYEVLAMKSAEEQHDTSSNVAQIYSSAGVLSSEAHKFDSALAYYKRGLDIAKRCKDTATIKNLYMNMISVLPNLGRENDAVKLLQEVDANYTFKGIVEKVAFEYVYLNALMNINKNAAAAVHLNKLLDIYNRGGLDAESEANILFSALRFYFTTGRYDEARMYLEKRKAFLKTTDNLLARADNELWAFQIDSAQAKYPAAISHYQTYKVLMDSVTSAEKLRQFNELQVQYSSEKKDKNIQLLTKKGLLQDAKLQRERWVRNSIIVGLIMVLLLAALLYNRYRLKQRTNILLEKKQEEINSQNRLLKKVLGEKEWLLREIHHQVKNNLQIVISLLNTQSAYLDNEDALVAIRNSQHRMHAMSLIHQKLYQSENLASIDMQWYIHELVCYMRESFDTDKRMEFILDIDKVELDVAQAVPIGLILNEAISNTIKYAFPYKQKGKVNISLKNMTYNACVLTIADNGVGLPPDFDLDNTASLGMSLMRGLSDQVEGAFSVTSQNGCIIQTRFEIHQELMSSENESANKI